MVIIGADAIIISPLFVFGVYTLNASSLNSTSCNSKVELPELPTTSKVMSIMGTADVAVMELVLVRGIVALPIVLSIYGYTPEPVITLLFATTFCMITTFTS